MRTPFLLCLMLVFLSACSPKGDALLPLKGPLVVAQEPPAQEVLSEAIEQSPLYKLVSQMYDFIQDSEQDCTAMPLEDQAFYKYSIETITRFAALIKEKTVSFLSKQITRDAYLYFLLMQRMAYLQGREQNITCCLNEKKFNVQPTSQVLFDFFNKSWKDEAVKHNERVRILTLARYELLNLLIKETFNMCTLAELSEKTIGVLSSSVQLHPLLTGEREELGHPDEVIFPYAVLGDLITQQITPARVRDILAIKKHLDMDEMIRSYSHMPGYTTGQFNTALLCDIYNKICQPTHRQVKQAILSLKSRMDAHIYQAHFGPIVLNGITFIDTTGVGLKMESDYAKGLWPYSLAQPSFLIKPFGLSNQGPSIALLTTDEEEAWLKDFQTNGDKQKYTNKKHRRKRKRPTQQKATQPKQTVSPTSTSPVRTIPATGEPTGAAEPSERSDQEEAADKGQPITKQTNHSKPKQPAQQKATQPEQTVSPTSTSPVETIPATGEPTGAAEPSERSEREQEADDKQEKEQEADKEEAVSTPTKPLTAVVSTKARTEKIEAKTSLPQEKEIAKPIRGEYARRNLRGGGPVVPPSKKPEESKKSKSDSPDKKRLVAGDSPSSMETTLQHRLPARFQGMADSIFDPTQVGRVNFSTFRALWESNHIRGHIVGAHGGSHQRLVAPSGKTVEGIFTHGNATTYGPKASIRLQRALRSVGVYPTPKQ